MLSIDSDRTAALLSVPAPLKKRVFWCTLALYLFTFSWIIFLTQGLPIGDFDDWDHILAAQDLSWSQLATNVLTPWSKSDAWVGQTDRVNEVSHRRVFLSVVLKAIQSSFGFEFLPFYIFSKAIFFAGTVSFIFFFLCLMTRSPGFSFAGIVFYLTIPAHYPHLLWITDPITMVHFFMMIGIWAFLHILKNIEMKGTPREFYGWLAVLFLAGGLAMKTKEPALSLPLTLGSYSCIFLIRKKDQWHKVLPLLFVLAWQAFLIVPAEHILTHSAIAAPTHYRFDTLSRLLLRNYQTGYDDEVRSAFFSWQAVWPVSIARTFGFFALWTLIAFLLIYIFHRLKNKELLTVRYFDHPLVRIAALWFAVELFMMGRFQPDPRYFSGTMIPLTLLSARLIQCVLRSSEKRAFLLSLLVLGVLGYTSYTNYEHLTYLRLLAGKRAHRLLNTAKTIYSDIYPSEKENLRNIGFFYTSMYPPPTGSPRIENVLYFSPLEYDRWNKTNSPSWDGFAKAAQSGAIYYVTYEKAPQDQSDKIVLIASLDQINHSSLFEKMIYKMKSKKKSPEALNIYKWNAGKEV